MKKATPAILHADEDLIVVEKPAGMLSIPDRFDLEKPNLLSYLQTEYGQVMVVHRIDRETSGILVFARNEDAHRHLNQQFLDRTVEKIYLALVDGKPQPPVGEINQPIGPHPSHAGKMMINNKGKQALTLYRLADTFKAYSLVEADIKTGRQHQIRVHFASIGHPLVVDPLYGKREAFYLSEAKMRNFHLAKKEETERPLMSRLTLHSHQLVITHPRTEERLSFSAPLPKDFKALLSQLGKWGK